MFSGSTKSLMETGRAALLGSMEKVLGTLAPSGGADRAAPRGGAFFAGLAPRPRSVTLAVLAAA